jgi:hypothetical protein
MYDIITVKPPENIKYNYIMTSVTRSLASTPRTNGMTQTDLSFMTSYTVNAEDAQLYYNGRTTIQIELPSKSDAKWKGYPIIYITNMSNSFSILMRFNLGTDVKVKAPDRTNYESNFSVRGGFSGYIVYVGDNQWMLQGVGANFDGV